MVDMESTTAHQLQTAEPIANASAIFEDISDTKPTDNMSSSVALLPPNDASIITLLAAQAQDDHELQAQLKSSTLIKPGGPIPPTGPFDEPTAIEDPTALTGLILGIHQRLQEHHGLPVDPTIYDPARDDSWRLELVTNWGVRVSQLQFTESYIASKALELLHAIQCSERDSKPFPFTRLPLELRQEVYRHALAGDCRKIIAQSTKPDGGALRSLDWMHQRLSPRRSRFRSARVGYGMWINTAILRTSKAIHDEAENFLYQLHEFDFTHDVSRVVPFLQSLSDEARQNVSRLTVHLINAYVISVGPPGQPRLGGSAIVRANTPDWGQACSYIAHNVRLRELAFRLESEVSEDFQSLPWVQNMVQIKGLRMLTYYERYWQGQREHWRISDEDRSTTDTSDRNQALLSYLRSHMLKVPTKRC